MSVKLNNHLIPINNKRSTPTPNNNPSLGPVYGYTRTIKPEDTTDDNDGSDDGGEPESEEVDDSDDVETTSFKKHVS